MRTEKCRNADHHICTCMCDHIGSCPAVFCVRSLFECVQITHICEPDDNWTAAILTNAFRSVHHSRFSRSRQQWIAFSSPQKTTHMPTDINIHYIFPTHTHTHTPIISTYDRVIVTMKLFQLGERPKLVRTNCVSTRFVWVLVETACFMLFGVRLMRTQMWLSNTHTKRSRLWTRKDCVCVSICCSITCSICTSGIFNPIYATKPIDQFSPKPLSIWSAANRFDAMSDPNNY